MPQRAVDGRHGGRWLSAYATAWSKLILSNTACYYPDPTFWVKRPENSSRRRAAALVSTTWTMMRRKDFAERAPDVIARMTEEDVLELEEAMSAAWRRCAGHLDHGGCTRRCEAQPSG